ncbi:MAG TPA: sugar ABC transporter substrate-binding protein [Terriglobales bacterium]|nr:sugar ABC transporter substrate-binding protein [Terriglobales bacterium]
MSASPSKPPKVLLSLTTRDNDYQQAHAAAAESVAGRFGVQLEIVYADSDAVGQVQQILTAIQRRDHGISAVITEPVGTAMLNVAEQALRAGIAWGVLNREADYIPRLRLTSTVPVFEISVDQLEVGRIQAKQMSRLFPAGGTVLYIMGPQATTAATLRAQGTKEQKPSNVQLKSISANWTQEGGYRAVQSLLKLSTTRSSGFVGIVSQNDEMAIGARRAFGEIHDTTERNAWLNLPFLGVDGLPSTGQQYVHRKLLTATVVTPAVAGIALETFMNWWNHKQGTPERLLVPSISYPAVETLQR